MKNSITNFKPSELLTTSTGKDNIPATFDDWQNIYNTALALQRIRNKFGKPIKVNSGYRSLIVNSAVGGSKTSAHLKGLAADIVANSCCEQDNRILLSILKESMQEENIDQLIIYTDDGKETGKIRWFHVGFCDGIPRHHFFVKLAK